MLREFLRGYEAASVQTVGNMTMIALVSQDTECEDVGTIDDLYLQRDSAYDQLTMGSNADQVTIVPNGYTLVTKESAQDRAVRSKELLAAKSSRTLSAFCVQSSQGGFMGGHDTDKQKVRMLPATIKKAAYTHRNAQGYDGLWNSLATYNSSMGIGGNFLKSFFDKFKQQMDEFIAEFELVPHQRGAIILINDEPIGVEIAPNPMAFSAQWELLIRDCYGSEAIARQKEVEKVDETAVFADSATLEELSANLDKFEEKEWTYVEKLVNTVLSQNESSSQRQLLGGLAVVDIETEDYVGQAVRQGDKIIDLTLLSQEASQKGFRFGR
jgi:hypothetical protein